MRVKGLKAVILEGGGGKVCGQWTVWGREREQNGRMGMNGDESEWSIRSMLYPISTE